MIAKVCVLTLLVVTACLACHVPGHHHPGLCGYARPQPLLLPCHVVGWPPGCFGGPGLSWGGPGLGWGGLPVGHRGGAGGPATSHQHGPGVGHSSAGASGCGCGCVDAHAEGWGKDSGATAGLTGHFY